MPGSSSGTTPSNTCSFNKEVELDGTCEELSPAVKLSGVRGSPMQPIMEQEAPTLFGPKILNECV